MRFVLRIVTSEQVMDVMFSVSGVVMCCISGQQLNGGYGVDDMTRKGRGRIHHIAIRNAVTEPVRSTISQLDLCLMILVHARLFTCITYTCEVEVRNDELKIKTEGKGMLCHS